MRDRRCLWCGGRAEYTLLIRRQKESSFRRAVRFEVCSGHGGLIGQRVAQSVDTEDDAHLVQYLWPRTPLPQDGLVAGWT